MMKFPLICTHEKFNAAFVHAGYVNPYTDTVTERRCKIIHPVLIDFGSAFRPGKQDGISGTPLYTSPEKMIEKYVDGKDDVYALGVIFYCLFGGRVAYDLHGRIECDKLSWFQPSCFEIGNFKYTKMC